VIDFRRPLSPFARGLPSKQANELRKSGATLKGRRFVIVREDL